MEGEGKRRVKFFKKKGRLYAVVGERTIRAPKGVVDAQFVQWLVQYLKPKRKKKAAPNRPPAPAPAPVPAVDQLSLSAQDAADPSIRNFVNAERAAAGLDRLDAPIAPGLPPQLDEEAQSRISQERETKRAARKEREAKLTSGLSSRNNELALIALAAEFRGNDLKAETRSADVNATDAERVAARKLNKPERLKWLPQHQHPGVVAEYDAKLEEQSAKGGTPKAKA